MGNVSRRSLGAALWAALATAPCWAGESPAVSYRLDVAPILSKAGCNAGACHGNAQGKGGFRLSLRGEDPSADWLALTRDTLARRINITHPNRSLLLLKPTGQVPHEGGQRFPIASSEFNTLKAWISQGALDDLKTAPRVAHLEIKPASAHLQPTATNTYETPLRATVTFQDGTTRDVSTQATYELNDPARATVSPAGLVQANRSGQVAVSVRYLDARATARIAFLPDRPHFQPSAPPANNFIDHHVFAQLHQLKIKPSSVCDDETFLRRAFLDTLGVLPTAQEARAFLADTSPNKRAALIDTILERPEFADYWALKWADLLRNEEKVMGPKGVWIFQRWLRDQIDQDVPMSDFARALLVSGGSTWRNPPASFYRTNRDPQTCAETVGQVFLGVRLQCARCHNHPFDTWTQNDYYGLAAAFANIKRKQIDNERRDKFDNHEINGDEVIFHTGPPRMRQPRSGQMMTPRPLGGDAIELSAADENALDDLADRITADRQFARVLANRLWFHLMGQGIVDPVDDFRDSNPASNPKLLEALTDEFLKQGLKLKPLARAILNSTTYQLASATNETNADDEINFSHARIKQLPAEVLLDAIGQALGAHSKLPRAFEDARATQIAGIPKNNAFLKTFGKPDRLLSCECERSEDTTLAQALQLINGPDTRAQLESNDNRIASLLQSNTAPSDLLENLYLSTLSRLPTAAERDAMLKHVASATNPRKAWEDVAWALINSKEFLLRH